MNANDANDKDEDRRSSWKKLKTLFNSSPKTTEDVVALVGQASEKEIINDDAKRIIEGALEVAEKQARDIMIPRTHMTTLKASDPLQKNLNKIIKSGHSRYPVLSDNKEDVLGILLSKDLLEPLITQRQQQNENPDQQAPSPFNLLNLLRPAVLIPENKRLNILLKQFREDRNHMAMVVDEYGSLSGLITIEDVLEEIVGEIEDEHDDDTESTNNHIRRLSTNHFVINALAPIEDFNKYFETDVNNEEFDTIGGFITNLFGHLPKRNETIAFKDYTFHVVQADSRRVRLLRMTRGNQHENIAVQ